MQSQQQILLLHRSLAGKKREAKRSLEITTRRMGKTKKRFFPLVRCIVFLSFLRCSSIRCSAYMSIVPATKQYNDFKHKYIPFSFPVSPPLRSSHAICREKTAAVTFHLDYQLKAYAALMFLLAIFLIYFFPTHFGLLTLSKEIMRVSDELAFFAFETRLFSPHSQWFRAKIRMNQTQIISFQGVQMRPI